MTSHSVGNFADVKVSMGVHRRTMGRYELGDAFTFFKVTESGLDLSAKVVNAQPVSQSGPERVVPRQPSIPGMPSNSPTKKFPAESRQIPSGR